MRTEKDELETHQLTEQSREWSAPGTHILQPPLTFCTNRCSQHQSLLLSEEEEEEDGKKFVS